MSHKEKVLKEIGLLEDKTQSISDQLGRMKDKALGGGKITVEELQLAAKDIQSLDDLMRERQDVGH